MENTQTLMSKTVSRFHRVTEKDKLPTICQIRQTFPPPNFCAIRYKTMYYMCNLQPIAIFYRTVPTTAPSYFITH